MTPRWSDVTRLPQTDTVYFPSTEPALLVTPGDEIYVFGTLTHMWRSQDGGRTFSPLGTLDCRPIGGVCGYGMTSYESERRGGGDGDLALLPNGTLAWIGLSEPTPPAANIPFQLSADRGDTWTVATDLAPANKTDRPWIAATSDGALHVIWRDFGGAGGATILDDDYRAAVLARSSRDGGSTWGPATPIVEDDAPVTGDAVVDVAGRIYVPLSRWYLEVARSDDQGVTWSTSRAPSRWHDAGTGDMVRAGFPEIAVDAGGTLYLAWAADEAPEMNVTLPLHDKAITRPRVHLSVSHDYGRTWSAPVALSTNGHTAVMPALVAGDAGRVGVAWYETARPVPGGTAPSEWRLMFAQSVTADMPSAHWETRTALDAIHVGHICVDGGTMCEAIDRSRGDYFDIALRPHGFPIISFVISEAPVDDELHRTSVAVVRMEGGTPFWEPRGST